MQICLVWNSIFSNSLFSLCSRTTTNDPFGSNHSVDFTSRLLVVVTWGLVAQTGIFQKQIGMFSANLLTLLWQLFRSLCRIHIHFSKPVFLSAPLTRYPKQSYWRKSFFHGGKWSATISFVELFFVSVDLVSKRVIFALSHSSKLASTSTIDLFG